MRILLTILLLTFVLNCGCVRDVVLSAEERASIKAVRLSVIEGSVSCSCPLPSKYGVTIGNAWYATPYTAPIGMMVDLLHVSAEKQAKAQILRGVFEARGVDVTSLVTRELNRQLRERSVTPIVLDSDGEQSHELVVTIAYGLEGGDVYGGSHKPFVELQGRLLDGSEKTIWRKHSRVGASHHASRLLPFPDPLANPRILRQRFRSVANQAIDEMLDHMQGDLPQPTAQGQGGKRVGSVAE